ncbi:MAG: hypothetical protein LBN26_01280 [Christensenellaceae bacterium]|jgi:hypothetical protein|nr:hypothetical protein [Christensenellaceae bacterium]
MSYKQESAALFDDWIHRKAVIDEKYKDYQAPSGILDYVGPYEAEVAELHSWFSSELKRIQAKYPE